jgi:hypothetical protein
MCNIHRNGWRITRDMQRERRALPLESRSYNKSHPSPKAYCFSKIDDQKHFLVCIEFCLTFLNSTCLSFTPWFAPIIESYHCDFPKPSHDHYALLALVHRWCWASTLNGVGPPSSHVTMISPMSSCIHPVLLSKWTASPITSEAHFSVEVCTPAEGVHSWHRHSKKLFLIQSIRWNYQTKSIDRRMQHWWESTMSFGRPRRRSCIRDQEVFLSSIVPKSSVLPSRCVLHRFLCSPPS